MDKIKVLIADDHAIMRMGLISLFESESDIEVVGEARNGELAVQQAVKLKPDIVIMDLLMPILDGIKATRLIREKVPSAKILVLTTSTISDMLKQVLDNGAMGIVIKSDSYDRFAQAIRDVFAGKRHIPPEIQAIITEDPPAKMLTDHQLEVLQSAARGFTNDDISKQLGISKTMVKKHLKAAFDKLGAANRAEAIAIAQRKQLLKM